MKLVARIMFLSMWVLAGFSCQHPRHKSILPEDVKLRQGDVVFRRGSSLTSRGVVVTDRDGRFSHVGIVVDSCGTLMIVHAVPDEHDYADDVDRVKMDSPDIFYDSQRASIGAVCRPRDSLIAYKAAITAMHIYKSGVKFDHEYDDQDTTSMYCTELVEYAFSRANHSLTEQRRHRIVFPTFPDSCILPSDIYHSDFLEVISVF